ncbi:hypothetical protein [Alicyclobacillus suci]|uniref:hypothetical protein n=1 Tax=Alicyclobacillus suci TaxID=2816080 RepID=UPI001A8D61F2|nr:hypothetical protein [Alicyclobacillus suci]
MASVWEICIIVIITAIDNALLAGVLIPQMEPLKRRITVIVVAIALAISQVVCSTGVDYFIRHTIFRLLVILLLAWMSIRVLYTGQSRYTSSVFATTVRLFLFTFVGNLDNILWLGSVLQGDRLWITILSFASIPIFVCVTSLLANQIQKQWWILPMGAGMMAWASASITFSIPAIKNFVERLDDAPVFTFQCLMTVCILVVGVAIRGLIRNKAPK